jgi:hypothetical protein
VVEFFGQFAEFGGGGAVVDCCDDVLGCAAELEEAVLEVGQFGGGQDYGVFGEAAALDGRAAFVGALAAGLGAVAARAADDFAVVGEGAAAPGAVACFAAGWGDPFGGHQLLVGGHGGIMPGGLGLGGGGSP